MKATVRVEPVDVQGAFSSKRKFRVGLQLHLDEEESAVVEQYGIYTPRIYEFLDMDDDSRIEIAKRLERVNADTVLGFRVGITIELDSIHLAGRYEDCVLKAFKSFRQQVTATLERVSRLHQRREIEL